ncbi:hypothetical protein DM785_02145 [Deinococcus actinosclerus]|nr:hypothetical protein DM785_02145 [Deinococcus actinosclerus]
MKLLPPHARWVVPLGTAALIATLIGIFFVPAGVQWRWLNFGTDLVSLTASFAMVVACSPSRWVTVGLAVVWVTLGLFTLPQWL